jgi:hypothetical protein
MQSEWMKVMLEEVARKREEAERARREQELRRQERGLGAAPTQGGSRRKSRPAET